MREALPAEAQRRRRLTRPCLHDPMTRPLVLIDNYDSFTFNLVQTLDRLGASIHVFRNDATDARRIARMHPCAIVISPGPGRPATAGITLDVIRTLGHDIPILGICLGMQAIGECFGARLVRAPRPVHGKTSPIFHDSLGIFNRLPNPFPAARYHSLVLSRRGIPDELVVTAVDAEGAVMGIRHRRHPCEGVQFHPESFMTVDGSKLLANFLRSIR